MDFTLPNVCHCTNQCNRVGSGRSACPCKNTGRTCTTECFCGRPKMPCTNGKAEQAETSHGTIELEDNFRNVIKRKVTIVLSFL